MMALGKVILGLTLLLILTSCLTVKPKIGRDNLDACKNLCRHNKGVLSMGVDLKMTITGLSLEAEECTCKNKVTFRIISSEQD